MVKNITIQKAKGQVAGSELRGPVRGPWYQILHHLEN